MNRLLPLLIALTSGVCLAQTAQTPRAEDAPVALSDEQKNKTSKVADDQDELQADVQELAAVQTEQEIIRLMEECRHAMNDAIDELEFFRTGSKTIAAQTEVIEKIYKAAEQKAQGSGKSGMKGMLQMMQGMMGNSQSSSGGNNSGHAGKNPGQGGSGESDLSGGSVRGSSSQAPETRRLSKSAGTAGLSCPAEFNEAMDAYNKSLNKPQSEEGEEERKAPRS